MTTSAELNRDFAKLERTALKVKRDRDALLAAAKTAKATFFLLKGLNLGTFYVTECELRYEALEQAIKEAEGA